MENSMEAPQKTKNRTIIWFISSTPGYIFENKNINLKRYMLPNVNSSTIYNRLDMEATQISYQWMNKKMCIYNEYYSVIKQN